MSGFQFPQGNELPNDQELLEQNPPPAEELGFTDLLADYASLRPNERVRRSIRATEAQLEETWQGTAVGLWARSSALDELESMGGKTLTPEEANKLYPHMPVPYKEPVSELVAKYKSDEFLERSARRQAIEAAPNYGMASLVGGFVQDVGTHLADPIETATMFLGGAVFGAAARAGYLGTRAAATAAAVESGTATVGQRVGLNVLEATTADLAQNVTLELDAAAVASRERIDPFRVEDSLVNIATGLVVGPALGAAVSGLQVGGRQLGKFLDETSPEAKNLVVSQAIRDVESGRLPDVAPLREALARETSVTQVEGKLGYNFYPLRSEIPQASRRFYIATQRGMDNTPTKAIADTLFEGSVQATDNPGVANAAASRALSQGAGSVVEIDAAGLKILSVDDPLVAGSREEQAFTKALAEMGVEDPLAELRGSTPREILETLQMMAEDVDGRPEPLNALKESLKEMGYDALVSEGRTRAGVPVDPHNALTFLDESKIRRQGFYEPDPEVRQDPPAEAISRAMAERDALSNRYDMDASAAEQALLDLDGVDFSPTKQALEARAELDSALEEFKMLDEQGILPKEMRQDYNRLQEMRAESENEAFILKAAQFCVRA